MADVRSLLRNELASRKGGAQSGSTSDRITKKRKVDNTDDITRKRIRSTNGRSDNRQSHAHSVQPPSAQATEEEEGLENTEEETAGPELPPEQGTEEESVEAGREPEAPDTTKTQAETSQAIDEDEWAAFERDVAAPTRVPQAPAAISAQATISAAPISAEQLAAQQQNEKDMAARARETEAEGEREDAARFMEDEFDEMEQLEERVRRLKQKREELRKKRSADEMNPQKDEPAPEPEEPEAGAGAHSDDDDDDDEDDDWDNWRFR
ncbi:hypothetical protein PHISCL_08019 [Aspergillus sclerotialis]|uniref:Uncharacterized protein n=1 Tax=Aspergillus sclerotialis TaxID=2070753 RepID=A0A3A2ZJU7_9EURO|nr:hypothetical protein PHISCL_08019 [Aspergillus sclerotialis]